MIDHMIDQLIIGNEASFDDFSASVAKREIKTPKKKEIKGTVPFSNKTYDFSKINGEIYWEERELIYVFEITADTPEELERLKTIFSNWVMNVFQENLHDRYIPDYHFVATYSDLSYEDEEGLEKTTITVIFSAYPFKISNELKVYTFEIPVGVETRIDIVNASSHKITPTFNSTTELTLNSYDKSSNIASVLIPKGETKDDTFKLEKGNNIYIANNSSAITCELTVSFNEEVV